MLMHAHPPGCATDLMMSSKIISNFDTGHLDHSLSSVHMSNEAQIQMHIHPPSGTIIVLYYRPGDDKVNMFYHKLLWAP